MISESGRNQNDFLAKYNETENHKDHFSLSCPSIS